MEGRPGFSLVVALSHQAGIAALSLELPKAMKLLLYDLAIRACPRCGLTWPGVPNLMRSTGMGETLLRDTLGELSRKDRALIVVHRYPTGGRGRATEYVVLPAHTELSTAPCGECQSRQKTPRVAKGIEGTNPPRGEGYSQYPTESTAIPHARVTHQQEVQQQQEGALTRAADPQATPSGAATPPRHGPPPSTATEARQEVERMLDASEPPRRPDRPSHAKGDGKAR
jgi:hypothetical protein